MGYRGVIFDLGGVVLGSPLAAIAAFERARDLPSGLINRTVVGAGRDGAWARLERGELAMDEFLAAFAAETAAHGHALSVADLRAMFATMKAASTPRPQMLDAIDRLRAARLKVAALTNNWVSEQRAGAELAARFDVFVESSVVGLRKPDPRIYLLTCRRLGLKPAAAVFLDDIGTNLKAARALGMHTIKVADPDTALVELGSVLGLELSDGRAAV